MTLLWKRLTITFLGLALISFSAIRAQEEKTQPERLPPGCKLVRIEAKPQAVELKHRFDYGQILLTGVLDDGQRIDVTRMAKLASPVDAVKVSPRGMVTAAKNGYGVLRFSLQGQSAAIPVSVANFDKDYKVSFVQDVMPIMSKIGCNAGTCHGAAKGKNGFQLSLRGYDPVFDYRALTDDIMGRRFDRTAPNRSLMLLKSTGEVPHVGGVLVKPGERYYELMRGWIAAGVKLDQQSARVTSIRVFPENPVIALPGMKQQTMVIATYADGSTRDVTAEAHLQSSNNEVAKADKDGLVTALRRGETAVLARYEGAYAAVPLIVMGDRSGFAWKRPETYNYIDELVYEKLKHVKVLPSGLCTDADFVRRLYLDLTGLPPTPEKVESFLADNRPSRQKREALVDELIGNDQFIEHWTNKWADLLQVNSKFLGVEGAGKFREWIRDALQKNMPYNEFAHEILVANGSNMQSPPASYWKILNKPAEAMENTTHLFLAIRFNCNKCHDHPFERWTQDQYYNMAAFFTQVGLKPDPKYKGRKIGGTAVEGARPLVEIVFDKEKGDIKHDRTGEIAPPVFPYVHDGMPEDKGSRREQLAKWITATENPYFAKSYVNRVWSYLLGTGLIEPIDDIRAGNPPTNPKLLKKLTEEFIAGGFDTRELMRTICKSRTYQHSIETNKWNADDDINYSHALARRLPAEVLFDAIHHVMDVKSNIPGMPAGARAAQLVDMNVSLPGGFLKLLGRPPRESACECERSSGMQLGPVLTLINGPVIANAINSPNNRIAKLMAKHKDNRKIVEAMFLSILNRQPTLEELAIGVRQLQDNEAEHKKMLAKRNELETALRDYEKQLDAKQTQWEASMKKSAQWYVLEPEKMESKGSTLDKQEDNSILVSGKNPTPELYTIEALTDIKGITAVRLEVLTHKTLPNKGPGRNPGNGNFVLNDFKLFAVEAESKDKPKRVIFKRALADFSQGGFDIRRAIDPNLNTGWAIAPQLGKNHVAVFELNKKIDFEKGTKLVFKMDHRFNGKKHNIGRFRLSVTSAPPPIQLKLLPNNIAKILHLPEEKRNGKQKTALRNYYRSKDQQLPNLQRALNEYQVPSDPRAIGAQDLAWALLNSRSFLFNH